MSSIPDVQGSADSRHIAITRVGIRDIRIPLRVFSQSQEQATVATAAMTVALPHQQKGTHMSRFIHLLNAVCAKEALSLNKMADLHRQMLQELNAEAGTIQLQFPYFVTKTAPVSGTPSMLDYQVQWESDGRAEAPVIRAEVTVPVTSLCPCSKEISDYGAHNQRSHIIIRVDCHSGVALEMEELINIAEAEGSCAIWSTLKRPDEKWVTERAYENPKFVEDIVRDVVKRLQGDKRFQRYWVASENFESIHNHSAYAYIDSEREA